MIHTVRVGIPLVAGALLALAGGAAGAKGSPQRARAADASLHVRIRIPRPGDVVLARIVVRGRPGLGVPIRLRLRVRNAKRVPPAIAAVGGVVGLHRRPLKFVSVIAMVNRRAPKPSGTSTGTVRFDPFIDIDLLDAKGAAPAEARHFYGAHVRVAIDILTHFGESGEQSLPELFQPVEADSGTPLQRALAERGLGSIPLVGLPARKTSAAREGTPDPNVLLRDVGDLAQSACSHDTGGTESAEKKVEGDLATSLVPVTATPSSERRCGLSRYSFAGLKLSFVGPAAGGKTAAYVVSALAGSVCGDPLKEAWDVSYTSSGEGKRSARPVFAKANPATIATRRFPDGSTLARKLQYATESGAAMRVSGVPKGKITNVVAKPAEDTLTSTAVQAC